MWLGCGITMQQQTCSEHHTTSLSANCAGLALLVTVTLSLVIAAWLFFQGVLQRVDFWQQHHPRVMLMPPYVHLRRLLLVQLWVAGTAILLGVWMVVVGT